MKKIIFLLAAVIAVNFSFAQVMEKPNQKTFETTKVNVIPTPCPVNTAPAVVVNNTINNNALSIPSAKSGFLVNKKFSRRHNCCFQDNNRLWDNTWNIPGKDLLVIPPNGSISNSFNTTTTNNYYQQPVKNCSQQCGYYYGYNDFSWFPWFLFLALIVLAIYLAFRNRGSSEGASSVTHSHTHTHKHEHVFPSTPPKVGDEKRKAPVPPAVDVIKILADLKGTGVTVTVNTDGSVTVDMPKPPVEEKKDQV